MIAAAVLTGNAQALEFEALGADRGLDAVVITALLVDRKGFLWVGSREGLYRYDGYRAMRFVPREDHPNSLTDSDIRTLYEDSDGTIWVATNNGGLNRYDPVSGEFTAFRHDPRREDSLSNDSIYGMAEAGDGRLWVGTQIGLNLLDPETGAARRFLHDPANPDSLSHDYVYAIHRDRSGSVWITTNGGGVNRWAPERQGFERFDLAGGLNSDLPLNDVFTVTETADGILWFGTRAGLVKLDPRSSAVERAYSADRFDTDLTITSAVLDKEGRIRMTALGVGIVNFDPETGEIASAEQDMSETGQLPAVPQLALALHDDLLFVGTWGSGVYAGRIGLPRYGLLPRRSGATGLGDRNVMAVLPGDQDGYPWIGTFGGGLRQFRLRGEQEVDASDALRALDSYAVLSIAEAAGGGMAVATSAGLWELSPELEAAELSAHDPANAGGLGPGYVTRVMPDSEGGLWIGVGGSGLHYRPPGSTEFRVFANDPEDPASLSDNYITDLLQTRAGAIWVATRSHGLNHCEISPWRCDRYAPEASRPNSLGHFHVTDLYRDSRDRLWVATDGGGLHLAKPGSGGQTEGFQRWTMRDGLISNAIVGVVEDSDGTIWVSTREGLSRLDTDTGKVSNFVQRGGLPTSHFNAGAAARDNQYLYFGSVDGLLSIPLGTPFSVRGPSPVSMTAIERPSEAGMAFVSARHPDRYTMPYGEILSVGFAVLDFAEVPHQYEYQLGESSEWIALGSKQDVTFFGLTPGHYVLRTRGRDVFGLWNEATPFHIVVTPPFWMTNWFRALVVAAVLILILSAHMARTAALRRRNVELERLKTERERALDRAEKNRLQLQETYDGLRKLSGRLESAKEEERKTISAELHDELGQMLTAAKLNMQMARKDEADPAIASRLNDSIMMMDRMIGQVRNISLNLRPPLLDEAGLVPALRHYLDSMEQRSGLKLTMDVGPDVSGNPPAVRTVVFRAVQEAVTNALRHARAKEIRIRLRAIEEQLHVTIEDNGVGFDPAETERRTRRGEHLGLLGLVERVHGAGGKIEITSSPGKGSRIEVSVPR